MFTWLWRRDSNKEPCLCPRIICRTSSNRRDLTAAVRRGSLPLLPPEISFLRSLFLFILPVKLAELCTSLLSLVVVPPPFDWASESANSDESSTRCVSFFFVSDRSHVGFLTTVSVLPSSDCGPAGSAALRFCSGLYEPANSGLVSDLAILAVLLRLPLLEPVELDWLTEKSSRSESSPGTAAGFMTVPFGPDRWSGSPKSFLSFSDRRSLDSVFRSGFPVLASLSFRPCSRSSSNFLTFNCKELPKISIRWTQIWKF